MTKYIFVNSALCLYVEFSTSKNPSADWGLVLRGTSLFFVPDGWKNVRKLSKHRRNQLERANPVQAGFFSFNPSGLTTPWYT